MTDTGTTGPTGVAEDMVDPTTIEVITEVITGVMAPEEDTEVATEEAQGLEAHPQEVSLPEAIQDQADIIDRYILIATPLSFGINHS